MPAQYSPLPSRSPDRLPRPGRPAPLRAFGRGSRSCDVISKASALCSDTRPYPAGPGAGALFTELGRGGGRRHGLDSPGETAAREAAAAPAPTAPPRATRPEPQPRSVRPGHADPCQPVQPRGRLQYACILQIPAPSTKPRVGDKSCACPPGRIRRGKTSPGLQNPGLTEPAGAFQHRGPTGRGRRSLPAATQHHHPAQLSTLPGRPGSQPRPEATPPPPPREKNWRRPMGGRDGV